MPEAQTYDGGCHCGRVRFAVTTALMPVISCNCSICSKRGTLLTFVGEDAFRHTAGSDGELTEYRFNTHRIRHLFCPVCGIASYGKGVGPNGKVMVAVNVRCLDGVDLGALEVTAFDGRAL